MDNQMIPQYMKLIYIRGYLGKVEDRNQLKQPTGASGFGLKTNGVILTKTTLIITTILL